MRVKYQLVGSRLYLYLIGELDQHYAKGVKDYIEEIISSCEFIEVVFNFQELTFMDSTGIGMLLGRYKILKKQGKKCYIENPMPSVEKVIELSGIYEIMPKI